MEREKFLKLLSKNLSGDISAAGKEKLDQAIKNNEEYKSLAANLDHYFSDQKITQPKIGQLSYTWEMIKAAEQDGFDKNLDFSTSGKVGIAYSVLLKVAVLLLLIGAGLFGYNRLNSDNKQGFSAAVATDQKVFKILDDGTRIWLNKKSTLSYNKAFGKYKREIFLEGEAYFDVVKNKDIPLFIHAGNIDIEVKGTAFNVKAQKGGAEIKVALVRGSIQVTDRLNSKYKVLLRPNEKLIFFNHNLSSKQSNFLVLSLKPNLLLNETKWTSDTLIFRKEKLKELALRMEKKYELKIDVQSEQLREKRFSGIFTNETIQQALAALKLSYPLTYTISDKLVVIKD